MAILFFLDNKSNILNRAFNYGFKTLPKDIAEPLIVGIVLSGAIALVANFESVQSAIAVIPNNFGGTLIKILIAMSFSIPMYICATAAVPLAYVIATSLGSPGAAVALLIAGPATNISTMVTTFKIVGRKSTLIYFIKTTPLILGVCSLMFHMCHKKYHTNF